MDADSKKPRAKRPKKPKLMRWWKVALSYHSRGVSISDLTQNQGAIALITASVTAPTIGGAIDAAVQAAGRGDEEPLSVACVSFGWQMQEKTSVESIYDWDAVVGELEGKAKASGTYDFLQSTGLGTAWMSGVVQGRHDRRGS